MKHSIISFTLVGAVVAFPATVRHRREVPQEHAHENILRSVNDLLVMNNPDNITDAVFGLLCADAAAEGAGKIADADCLQQATADQAFTNAKAAGDVTGMTNALIFRALERNTGAVGLASVPCQSIKAVNPEIAAIQQHQDPAGTGAQELNKQIASELARQIAAVGGDPTLANEASTFAPGQIGDPTAKGNTCDDANDAAGCINSQKLRVDDLSAAEITAAVSGASNATGIAQGNATAIAYCNATAIAQGNTTVIDLGNATAIAQGNATAIYQGNATAIDLGNATAIADAANSTANACAALNIDQAAADKNATADASANAGVDAAGNTGSEFGTCNPKINFGKPSDGRQQDAFEPADLSTFNHGSALNIAVISGFICSQIGNKCEVSAAAVSSCEAAAVAAQGLKGQVAADAFNSALGV